MNSWKKFWKPRNHYQRDTSNLRNLVLEHLCIRRVLNADLAGLGEEYRPIQAIGMSGDEPPAHVWTAPASNVLEAGAVDAVFAEGEAPDPPVGGQVEFGLDFTQGWTQHDVNLDGHITAIDALLVINKLNIEDGSNVFDIIDAAEAQAWWDVNGDTFISPIDALIVINYLNVYGPGPVRYPNALPHALDSDVSTEENHAVTFVLQSYDANGDDLTFQINSNPLHGTISQDGENVTYTPATDYVGDDSLSFRVNDGHGWSSTATVTITVTEDDGLPPTGPQNPLNGPIEVLQGGEATVTLVRPGDGSDFIYQITDPPQHGSLVPVQPNGHFTYTPQAGFSGADSFRYRVHDGTSWSQQYEATITVTAPVPTEPSIALAAFTPPSANLFIEDTYHIATFDVTGDITSIDLQVDPLGIEGYASFFVTTSDGTRISVDTPVLASMTIDLDEFTGTEIYVWTNTSNVPVTSGGRMAAVGLNGQAIQPTEWSKLHRVNAR